MNELRRYSRKSTKFYGTSSSSASRRSRISSTTSSSRTSSTITPTQQSLNLDEVLLINLFLETKVNQNACEKVCSHANKCEYIRLHTITNFILGRPKRARRPINDSKISENFCGTRN